MTFDSPIVHQASLGLAAALFVWAAATDALRFRIPNKACLLLLLLFPVFALTGPAGINWIEHFVVFVLVFAVGYGLYHKGWAGAGDIKLLAVGALWAGAVHGGVFLFVTAIAGGILSLGIGVATLVRARMSGEKAGEKLRKTPIPYGVAIALGGLCTLALLSHPDLLIRP